MCYNTLLNENHDPLPLTTLFGLTYLYIIRDLRNFCAYISSYGQLLF